MISLVYKTNNDELDTIIMCDDTKISDIVKLLDDIKDYKIIPYTSMDDQTTNKLSELRVKVANFRYLCRESEFNTKLDDREKKTIQDLLDAFEDVMDKVF